MKKRKRILYPFLFLNSFTKRQNKSQNRYVQKAIKNRSDEIDYWLNKKKNEMLAKAIKKGTYRICPLNIN